MGHCVECGGGGAQSTVQDVTGPKALSEYDLGEQVGPVPVPFSLVSWALLVLHASSFPSHIIP